MTVARSIYRCDPRCPICSGSGIVREPIPQELPGIADAAYAPVDFPYREVYCPRGPVVAAWNELAERIREEKP